MILVKHIDDALYFPLDLQPVSNSGYTLEMYSELSLTTLTFEDLSGEVNDDFIIIDLSEYADQIPNGEYNATIYDADGMKISLTLVRFDIESGGEYDDPEYVVYEDEFDGGYITTQNQEEAYESGYTDGVNSVILVSTGFTENGVYDAEDYDVDGFDSVEVNVQTMPEYGWDDTSLQSYHIRQKTEIIDGKVNIKNVCDSSDDLSNGGFAFYVSVPSGTTLYFSVYIMGAGESESMGWLWGEGSREVWQEANTYSHTYTNGYTGWIGSTDGLWAWNWNGRSTITDWGNLRDYSSIMIYNPQFTSSQMKYPATNVERYPLGYYVEHPDD